MLELAAALCYPGHYIVFKKEALLSHLIKGKFFEAVVSEVLTHHEVKKLVDHLRLTVQLWDFKAFKWLAFIHSVDLLLKLVKNPRHRSGVSLNIVDFKIVAFQDLNLGQINAKVFFHECKVIFTIYLYDELVLWRGQVVGLYFFQGCKAYNGYWLWKKRVLRTMSLLRCRNLFANL